jgi:hypothetical protein
MIQQTKQLEQRVARLEQELEQLKIRVSGYEKMPWWRQIAGTFEGDKAFEEIVRLGAAIRKADRKDSL